ncbi:MAG: helix-turn-helix domain-containing protein [Myxococcota bacterium]
MPLSNYETHVPHRDGAANPPSREAGRAREFRALPAILACRGSSLSKAQHLVLVHMSVRASRDDGACWAAVATLANDTNLDARTVRRVLRQLEALGVLEAHLRPGRSTWYRLFPDRIPRAPGRIEPPAEQALADDGAQLTDAASADQGKDSGPWAQRQGGHSAREDTAPPGGGHQIRPGRAQRPPRAGTTPSDPSRDPERDPSCDPNHDARELGDGASGVTSSSRATGSPRTSRQRPHEAFGEIVGIWAERVRPLVSLLLPEHQALDPASDLGAQLDARLRDVGRDDVALVLQWYATAADDTPRAPFLRERISDLSTLMRPPKFDEYLAFARAWWAAGHPERRTEPESGSRWTPEQQRRGNDALRRARLAQEARSVVEPTRGRCAA